ncbi:MAG: glycosyltransferase [Planctomycetaceae bacterium]
MASTIVDVDLAEPFPCETGVAAGAGAEALVWLHGRPLGRVGVPRLGQRVHRRGLARAAVRHFGDAMLRELVRNGMAAPATERFEVDALLALPTSRSPIEPGHLTVVIRTEGLRMEALDRCLAAVMASGVPPAEVIVVGSDRAASRPKQGPPQGPKHAPQPGGKPSSLRELQERWSAAAVPVQWMLDAAADPGDARCHAVEAARTPLVAFVDESVRVDGHWVEAVCRAFQDHPNAAVVTGSLLPDGASNDVGDAVSAAVARMARHNPLVFVSRCLRPDAPLPRAWFNVLPFGSAAAVAYRTEALLAMGGFDQVATGRAAATGEHFDLWLRALQGGRCLVRDPAASCRADGTPSLEEAAAGLADVAAGCSAALVAAAARGPRRCLGIMLVAQWFLRTAIGDLIRHRGVARSLAWARLQGHVRGMASAARALLRPRSPGPRPAGAWFPPMATADDPFRAGRIVPIDLALPADGEPQTGDVGAVLQKASSVPVAQILAMWRGHVLGLVEIVNGYRPVTLEQIRRATIDRHWDTLLVRFLGPAADAPHEVDGSSLADRAERRREAAARTLGERLATGDPADTAAEGMLSTPADHTISIVIPSRDRPAELRECLRSVLAQKTDRRAEIIVVDNHPASGLTPPVVAEFPDVRLVAETRGGSAYARNRGLLACRGSITVFVDDDVVVPDGWLEKMLAPFADREIAVVTGNVVPLQLETSAERLTEACSSLSSGGEPFRVDGEWFFASQAAIQAWDFGISANMAARTRVFRDPAVGFFAEQLGPGTPVGAGEDPYLVYRVIEAGYGLQYCADAWVWHRHRRTTAGLKRQMYCYAKSAVGYYLLTGFRHGDRRSRRSLFGGLQRHYGKRLLGAMRGRIDVPVWLVLTEISGHVAGAFAYLLSERRRRALDRDPAHLPIPSALPERSPDSETDEGEPWALDQGGNRPSPGEVPHAPWPRRGRMPHFLVIGAQKSGTSALHENLKKHPGIELVPHFKSMKPGWVNTKETHFFSGQGAEFGIRSLDDYARLFNDDGRIQGEVCPSYSSPAALERVAKMLPEAKLIYICREPVERLESAVNHMMQWRETWTELENFCFWNPSLAVEANLQRELAHPRAYGLLRMGIYADTVEQALRRFPQERLLLLVAEEYRANPRAVYDTICSFLGVERHEIDHTDEHVRPRTTTLSPEERRWLADFYRPHNERFFALLGRDVPSWSSTGADSVRMVAPG